MTLSVRGRESFMARRGSLRHFHWSPRRGICPSRHRSAILVIPPAGPTRQRSTPRLDVPYSMLAITDNAVNFLGQVPALQGDVPSGLEHGTIEAEFAQIGTTTILKKFLTYRTPAAIMVPKEKGFEGSLETPISLPSWLTEEDVNYFASKFEKSGFTGGLNYYRCFDLSWELTAPWIGVQVNVPTKFIVGDLDLTYHTPGIQDYIHKGGFKNDVPLLEDIVVMEGVGHFINQEKPHDISDLIYDFIRKF
ncbi:epoxide hydrolase 2-like [Curcuma longa]|uniref:epoxide hydrolase 2-like n=1 Tax=Curcuma longa TaxID=136217 RepID=UPI003D9EA0E7